MEIHGKRRLTIESTKGADELRRPPAAATGETDGRERKRDVIVTRFRSRPSASPVRPGPQPGPAQPLEDRGASMDLDGLHGESKARAQRGQGPEQQPRVHDVLTRPAPDD